MCWIREAAEERGKEDRLAWMTAGRIVMAADFGYTIFLASFSVFRILFEILMSSQLH